MAPIPQPGHVPLHYASTVPPRSIAGVIARRLIDAVEGLTSNYRYSLNVKYVNPNTGEESYRRIQVGSRTQITLRNIANVIDTIVAAVFSLTKFVTYRTEGGIQRKVESTTRPIVTEVKVIGVVQSKPHGERF